MITPEPKKRKYRTDWWTEWKGQQHYIGHDTWIEFDRDSGTIWYVDRDPGDCQDTPRAHKSIELLRRTGVMLIQHDDPNRSYKGWRYACEISELEVRGAGFWIRCKLKKLA